MGIRPFAEADIPHAADLYWYLLRNREGSAPPEVHASFRELYFDNPLADNASSPSLVYENNDGKIVGFLGVIVRKMTLKGEPLDVAFGGNLVVHPDARSSFAAVRMVSAYTSGQFKLCLADSANDLGRRLLDRMGFHTIPALNIHWARPLRPSHYAAYMVSKSAGRLVQAGLKFAARPFCNLADGVALKLAGSPFHQTQSPLHGSPLEIETLLGCLSEFRKDYAMWAEYDARSLQWLFSFMERRPKRGDLRKILVRNDKGKIVGWYIYYVKAGAVGEVVQIGGDRKLTKEILDHLFSDALRQGVIALHGVVDLRRMPDFSDKGCLFTCRGGWGCAYSRSPEILDVLSRGDAFFTRLDGEWCLDPGAD
jgi:hypothetical protein